MSHLIVDNFLSEEDFKGLLEVIHSSDFPWFTSNNGLAYENDFSDKYFVHSFYLSMRPNSNWFSAIEPILAKLDIKALLRAKVNLYLKSSELIHHGQHTDFDFEHKGFILYLNTNDGFTELEDGTQIQSIANRGLFFDPHKLHNSTNCTNELFRANISINYF